MARRQIFYCLLVLSFHGCKLILESNLPVRCFFFQRGNSRYSLCLFLVDSHMRLLGFCESLGEVACHIPKLLFNLAPGILLFVRQCPDLGNLAAVLCLQLNFLNLHFLVNSFKFLKVVQVMFSFHFELEFGSCKLVLKTLSQILLFFKLQLKFLDPIILYFGLQRLHFTCTWF